jgi:ribonuclease HI
MAKVYKIKIVIDACCHKAQSHKWGSSGRGYSAAAVIIYDEYDNILKKEGKYLGEMTPPQAEYEALLLALDNASEYCRGELEIWSDSELLVRQMNGQYRIKNKALKEYFDKAKSFEGRYKKVTYFHHEGTSPLGRVADQHAEQIYKKNRL